MKFTYDLHSIGWANVYLEINGEEVYIDPSYTSEPLIDLLDSLLHLIPECVPGDELKLMTTFEWDSEPTVHKWNLIKNCEKLQIQIIEYKDGNIGEPGLHIFDEECIFEDFIFEVITSLDSLLLNYGLVGYQENWHRFDFPIGRYLRLKQYYLNKKPYPVQKINKEIDSYNYTKSELSNDIILILKIINNKMN